MRFKPGSLKLPFVAVGVFALLGLALIIWPEAVTGIFPPLIGIVLIFAGVQAILLSMAMRDSVMEPGFKLLQGIVNILVGTVFIIKQDLSMAFLTILFGMYVLVSASVDFSEMLRNRRAGQPWGARFFETLFRFILGLLLLFSPFTQYQLWARLLGGYFVVTAAGLLHWLFQLRKIDKQEQQKQENDPNSANPDN